MYCRDTMNSSRVDQNADARTRGEGTIEIDDLERYRRELLIASYQLLGSPQDAEDVVQETMIRAWNARERYDPSRATVRTWLHRIATNTALSALSTRRRRPLPSTLVDASTDTHASLTPSFDVPWLLPISSSRFDGDDDGPAAQALRRGAVRVAFCAALQQLPARQRAALILCDVLDFSAAEAATVLDTSSPAINSLLQRARRTVSTSPDGQHENASVADDALIERYTEAFMRGDVATLTSLLAAGVVLEMPPVPLWYRGADHYREFMVRVYELRGTTWRTIRTSANGQPAFAAYAPTDGVFHLHTVQVLSVSDGAVHRNTVFQDPAAFAELSLPATI